MIAATIDYPAIGRKASPEKSRLLGVSRVAWL